MKYYSWDEPEYDSNDEYTGGNVVCTVSEEEILDLFWSYWLGEMVKKYGIDHPLISREGCIEDFVIIHGARESEP